MRDSVKEVIRPNGGHQVGALTTVIVRVEAPDRWEWIIQSSRQETMIPQWRKHSQLHP
jgi:hypothetical protein